MQLGSFTHVFIFLCSELLFMGSWHPLAPDILTMAEEHAGVETAKRAAISAPMDPKVSTYLC
jgi:hypothetical protein